jgi:hypothetical protein
MSFKLINKFIIYQRFINNVLFDYLNDIFIYLKNEFDY